MSSSQATKSRYAPHVVALALALSATTCRERTATLVEPSAPAQATPARRAPVVVAIVVDQLPSWVADERIPMLPADGFFRGLAREGTWVHAMRYPYAQTDTACGHASLHTGMVPAEHGITLNETPTRDGHRTSIFRDPETKLVTPEGPREQPGSSAARLLVPTVADRLRESRADAHILSVSLKDRAALLPAGRHPSHAIWFDANVGSFVTSTAVEAALPAWARARGDRSAVEKARSEPWRPVDPEWLASVAGKDDALGEGDLDGLGIVFPHLARSNAAFRATPMSDTMILDLALAGIDAEDDPNAPTLVLLSMSASDVIGHTFGPSSWEAWDQLRRLDASLAAFVAKLEARVGPVSVLLSSDHGDVPMPEARARPTGGGRLSTATMLDELRVEAVRTVGQGVWIEGLADGYVFLGEDGRSLPKARRDALDRAVVRALQRHEGVAAVFGAAELVRRCPKVLAHARGVPERAADGEEMDALVCRSFRDGAGAGEYYVVPRIGFFFEGDVAEHGAGHGTPYLYDRTVPLLVRGSARSPSDGGVSISEPVDFSAYAALEAALLGLDPRSPGEIFAALRAR